MDSNPGPECLRLKFSSANDSPYMEIQPVPSPLRISPPWIMNSLMTRWKGVFKYPAGCEPRVNSPVHILRKFSAVFGVSSEKSSILMRPLGTPPIVMSKNTTGFPRAMASNTIGSAMVTLMVASQSASAAVLQLRRSDGVRRSVSRGAVAYGATALRRVRRCITSRGVRSDAGSGHSLAATSIHATQLLVLAHSCSETRENESYRAQDRRAVS
ncbi:unnamed protein product [Pelagomonas calceolata]|uniref:Uncharacterized protein n=1 Tax=Pelagomonas calceolata TaxID=35677 RepID=A0A8J2WRU8_9STRA|nr:unnamed protein product [Pelagomonas calceolata]|mmetsp:Transcript_21327/g.63688  ORF Transcript_21327/g.63688 Transcript_21327/m.63688 type:complete len:213 (+) Transcript_21327:229-867(+)